MNTTTDIQEELNLLSPSVAIQRSNCPCLKCESLEKLGSEHPCSECCDPKYAPEWPMFKEKNHE